MIAKNSLAFTEAYGLSIPLFYLKKAVFQHFSREPEH